MYEQYLSEKATTRVVITDSIVKTLILRLRSEKVSETWFDEVQSALFNTLQDVETFLPGFRRSVWYIRLLAELDLLKDISSSDEEDSQSLDDLSLGSLEQVSLEMYFIFFHKNHLKNNTLFFLIIKFNLFFLN